MKVAALLFALSFPSVASGQQPTLQAPCGGWNNTNTSLIVTHADVPLYPPLAIMARQSGTVCVRLSIRQGVVISADTNSPAPPVLVHAAKENARTWRFTPDVTKTVEVTFIYELTKDEGGSRTNPLIEMQLPDLVKVTAKPVKPTTNYGK